MLKKTLCAAFLAGYLIAVQSAPGLDSALSLTQYAHRIWQSSQGLPQAAIYCIRQTPDGYICLGTQNGLIRFDGVRFTADNTIAGLDNSKIWVSNMLQTPDAMWLATNGSGLIRMSGDSATRFTAAQGMPSDNVNDLIADSHQAIWACTSAGLARVTGEKIDVFRVAQGLSTDTLRAATMGKDGTLYFGGDGAVINIYNGSQFTRHALSSLPADAVIYALLVVDDGTLWIGTSQGLVRLKDSSEQRFTTLEGLPDNWVFCLAKSHDADVWIGTRDGFARLRKNEIESFRRSDGLSQSTVYTLCVDREENLWVGTKHGLDQFLDRRLIPFTVSEGLPSNNAGPVIEDSRGQVYAGTLGAGLARFNGRRFEPLGTGQNMALADIRALAAGPDSELWFSANQSLVQWRDDGVQRVYTAADGLPAGEISSLVRDKSGDVWIGSSTGLAVLRQDKILPIPGLSAGVLAMAQIHDGSLLLAVEGKSLYRLDAGSLHTLEQDRPCTHDVDALYEDADGLIWMGTLGGGLRLLRGRHAVDFSVGDGLADDEIYAIVPDHSGRLWMACSKGIFWVDRSKLLDFAGGISKSVDSTPYSPTESQRTVECQSGVQPAAWAARDGRIWFSTTHGVIYIDPEHLDWKLPPAPVALESVWVNGQPEPLSKIHDLPPGDNNLEFYYTALSFQVPQRITFRYKLDGWDKDWIDAGTRRDAFYTNLPPGNYRFQVQAINFDKAVSEFPGGVAMTLEPHFYQRAAFIPLCAGALVLLVVWMLRTRIRNIKSQMRVILSERGRIARELHDTLLQGFSGVTMEMQALSTRLETPLQRGELEEIIRDAGNCMREARRSVAGLRGPQGTASGLASSIAQTARQMTEARDVRLKLKLDECPEPLAPDVEYNLLRIVQEAMANSVQHSGARQIDVALRCQQRHLRLSVQDDGSGFDLSGSNGAGPGHYGLIGMKERATQIGALLRLQSAPGEGTCVSVEYSTTAANSHE